MANKMKWKALTQRKIFSKKSPDKGVKIDVAISEGFNLSEDTTEKVKGEINAMSYWILRKLQEKE